MTKLIEKLIEILGIERAETIQLTMLLIENKINELKSENESKTLIIKSREEKFEKESEEETTK
jgi:hypothetical protein